METFFGKYRVIREIGRGAMGSVYLAFDTVLEREVAVKTISSTIREEHLKERFIREARAAGKLCHNNIVTIYDFGVEDDRLYIVMEYLEGKDLYHLIAERVPLDIVERLEIVRQICVGLDFAHRNGVIHRDIKPANIRILNNGSVKIVDFGLAMMQTSSLTQSGAFLGTPSYVAPERLQGESGDKLSDQFSVGIILYEFLTHQRAFDGETISTIIYNVLNSEPKGLDPKILARFPHLQTIIQKAIAKKPNDRYASLSEMAEDIQRLIERMKLQNFTMSEPLPVADQRMETAVITQDTQVEEPKAAFIKRKKIALPTIIIISIICLVILARLLWLFLSSPAPTEPLPAAEPAAHLIFDVKPYAVVQKLVRDASGESIPLDTGTETGTTPLKLTLTPGLYRIFYSHPLLQGKVMEKEVRVTSGQTLQVTAQINDGFIDQAIKHFSLPLPVK